MNPENHLNDDDYWNVISDQEAQYQSSVMGDDDLFRLTRQTFKDLDDEINSNLDKEYGQGGTDDGWCDLFPETNVKNKKDGIEKLETLRSAMIGVLRDMKEHGFIGFNEYDDFIKSNKYLKSKIKKLNKGDK